MLSMSALPLATTYSRTATVPDLFAAAANRFADKPAVIGDEGMITYDALLHYAHAVAALLREKGVGRGATVGIVARRSLATVGGILGTLFAGAAYLALDVCTTNGTLLAQRVQLTGMRALLSETPLQVEWLGSVPVFLLPSPLQDGGPVSAPLATDRHNVGAHEADAGDAAYIMFTSGSTGTPKGVLVPHRAIVRLVSDQQYIDFGPEQTFLLHSPLDFDASTLELWGALLHGGSLVLAPDRPLALQDFTDLVAQHSVTTLWLTAALFHLLARHAPEACAGLRQLLVGGDVVSPAAVRAMHQLFPGLRIVNGYGPTESTTFATTYTIPATQDPEQSLPIGRPIAHTFAYILDDQMEPVPDGRPGQLVLGGDGIALGYIQEPALTAERFREDPFSPREDGRMYLTGDRVERDGAGLIHFRGRLDRETKLLGHRVDLDEVEAVLTGYPRVQHGAVFVRETGDDGKQLIAAVEALPQVAASAGSTPLALDERELKAYLAERLPGYAVPALIAILPAMPLSANGKLDRAAVLASLAATSAVPAPPTAPPATDTLAAVRTLWQTMLELKEVGADENFFDVGGDSLLLIGLHFRLNQLGPGTIELMDLFSSTTPRKMAALLDSSAGLAAGRA